MKKLMLIAIIGLCGNAVFAQKSGKKLQVTDKVSSAVESKSASTDGLWISVNDANNSNATDANGSAWKAINPKREAIAPKKLEK